MGLGAVVAIGGVFYGVVTVGVPSHDATPAQASAEKAHLAIFSWALGVGLVVFTIGFLLSLVLLVLHLVRGSPNKRLPPTGDARDAE